MSRIGNALITIPQNVEVTIGEGVLKAKGPKGELSLDFNTDLVSFKLEEGKLTVQRKNESKEAKSHHGLYRSLANNIVEGVTNGFSKTLEINGVGYRVALKGKGLELNLGFSHPINFDLPDGLEITFNEKNQNIMTISGIDKQLVSQVAANIRKLRPPEPYKGKGIKYSDEHIVRKAGKSAAKAEG